MAWLGSQCECDFVHVGLGCAWLSPGVPGHVLPTAERVQSGLLVAEPALGGLSPLPAMRWGRQQQQCGTSLSFLFLPPPGSNQE